MIFDLSGGLPLGEASDMHKYSVLYSQNYADKIAGSVCYQIESNFLISFLSSNTEFI